MTNIFSDIFLNQIIGEIKKSIIDFKKIAEKSAIKYPNYMSLKEAAQYSGCTVNTFKKFIKYGLPQIVVEDMNPMYAKHDIDDFMFKHRF